MHKDEIHNVAQEAIEHVKQEHKEGSIPIDTTKDIEYILSVGLDYADSNDESIPDNTEALEHDLEKTIREHLS